MTHPGARILTVIPNLERSLALGRLLALLGYEVIGATDTPCAALLATHMRPDALLVDAALAPDETLARLCVHAPQAPALVIDTLANPTTRQCWFTAGAAAYCATLPASEPLEHALASLCPARRGGPHPGPWAVVGLLAALAAHDPAGTRHARRVAALTLSVGRRLELQRACLQQAGWGALLHEIGRLALPREALGPVRQLTPYQRHLRGQLPRLALQVVGALPLGPLAHAVIGGPEYCPEAYGPSGPLPLAQRIVPIVDAFDTLARAHPTLPAEGILAYLEPRYAWDGAIFATLRAVLAAEAAGEPLARAVGAPN